jgi:hypothetical protein
VPVLPIIDLLILLGWSSLMVGAVVKAIYLATSYRPTILGLGPFDFLVLAGVFLVFALSLAARTWVKANEPRILAMRSQRTPRDGFPGLPEPPRNGTAGSLGYERARTDRPDEVTEAVGR